MTNKQFLKENPEKYVMVTYQFGDPLYIGVSSGLSMKDVKVSTEKDQAELWSAIDNGNPHKISYYKAATGYKQLQFEKI